MTAIRHGRRSPSPALSASLVLAVTSGSSSDEHGAHDVSAVMSATVGTAAQHVSAAASDCAMGEHVCVFVRADVVALVVAVGWILAIAPLRAAMGVRLPRRAVVLGRPPPWAVLDHLQLSVIRR